MSNEHRYLKSILFNYYAGHGTGVPCVCGRAAMLRRKAHGHSGARKCSPVKSRRFQGRKNLYLEKTRGRHCPIFQSGDGRHIHLFLYFQKLIK